MKMEILTPTIGKKDYGLPKYDATRYLLRISEEDRKKIDDRRGLRDWKVRVME